MSGMYLDLDLFVIGAGSGGLSDAAGPKLFSNRTRRLVRFLARFG